MKDNEKELLDIIREHDDPATAIEVAIKVILGFLKQDEASQAQQIACSQVSA